MNQSYSNDKEAVFTDAARYRDRKSFVAAVTSHRGNHLTSVTVFEQESKRAVVEATQFDGPSDVITQGAGNNAEPSARFDEEMEQYFVEKLLDAVKKLGEDMKKALDNVGRHMEFPL